MATVPTVKFLVLEKVNMRFHRVKILAVLITAATAVHCLTVVLLTLLFLSTVVAEKIDD